MESRITVISIIVSDREAASRVNELLHEYSDYVLGRLGLPCEDKGVSVICVVLDVPADKASALSGKLGMIPSVTSKTTIAKASGKPEND